MAAAQKSVCVFCGSRAGDNPALGPVELQLPGSPVSPSGGFAEETNNLLPNELEPPLVSQLQMFVEVTVPQENIQAFNQQPIILTANLSQITPAKDEAYHQFHPFQLRLPATITAQASAPPKAILGYQGQGVKSNGRGAQRSPASPYSYPTS